MSSKSFFNKSNLGILSLMSKPELIKLLREMENY